MLMRDSISAGAIPSDTPVVAGYADGLYAWSAADWARFPNAVKLVIAVHPQDQGDVLDVENGDATPGDCPGWVARFNRPNRRRPTIYCNRTTWQQVTWVLGSTQVDYWISTLDGTQSVPGAVAVQYKDFGGYDESIIQDESWVVNYQEVADAIIYAFRGVLLEEGQPPSVAAVTSYSVPLAEALAAGDEGRTAAAMQAVAVAAAGDPRYVPSRLAKLEADNARILAELAAIKAAL